MKTMKSLALILMSCCCVSMMAVQKTPPQIIAETEKAMVVREEGQDKLVLITGRKSSYEAKDHLPKSADIELRLNEETWNSLLAMVDASWGEKPIRMKTIDGSNVDIQKAKINGEDGLIFTSGTTYVALLDRDVKSLRNQVKRNTLENSVFFLSDEDSRKFVEHKVK